MFNWQEWLEADRKKHNVEWAQEIIRIARINKKRFVDLEESQINMSYLLSIQDMAPIKKQFKNTVDTINGLERIGEYKYGIDGQDIVPLPIWEKLFRIMIAEIKKVGLNLSCRSSDPASQVSKEKDKSLLKKKAQIEADLSKIHTNIGQPPVNLHEYEARFGEKLGTGNIEKFKAMNFNGEDEDDLDIFFEHFYKLACEIAAEEAVNAIMEFNKVENNKFDLWATDLIAKKACASQIYVNSVTGSMDVMYIDPTTVWMYGGGRRKDWNDANAKIIEVRLSIKEMLNRIGNSFSFKNNMDKLIMAIMYTSNVEVTGIFTGDRMIYGLNGVSVGDRGVYSLNDFMQLKVTLGYIEFNTQEQEDYAKEIENQVSEDNYLDEDNQPKDGAVYPKKARFQTPMYKSYYLPVSSFDQILFNFGKLPYQNIEGYYDVESAYTILTFKEVGLSLARMSIPLIDRMHTAWYKLGHELNVAKTSGMEFNTSVFLGILEDLQWSSDGDSKSRMQQIMQLVQDSPNRFSSYPLIDGVRSQQQHILQPVPNGIPESALTWMKIYLETQEELKNLSVGNSPLRQGDAPGSRNSMNNEFKALENSENSTSYIPDGITEMCQGLALRALMYIQSITAYKDKDTIACNFLENLIGIDTINDLKGLNDYAPPRIGINVESINQSAQRTILEKTIELGVQNKTLSVAESILIRDYKSPKAAFRVLAYFEQAREKKAAKNAQAMQQQDANQAMQLEQMKLRQISMKVDGDIEVVKLQNEGTAQNHTINQEGSLAKQAMKQAADSQQIYENAHADLLKQQALLNSTGSIVGAPPPPLPQQPPPAQNNSFPQSPQQSAIGQQMELAAPQTTGFNHQ